MDILEELKKQIIFSQKLHALELIDYARFLEIYQNSQKLLLFHGIVLSKIEFAYQILELSKSSYEHMAYSKGRPQILKHYTLSEDEVLSFRNFVMKNAKLHSGDALTYLQCKELFDSYYIGLSEKDFMQKILDVSNKALSKARTDSQKKVWILKQEQVSEEYIRNLRRLIILSEKLYAGKPVNYETFKSIYEKYYTPLSEVSFASRVLDISESNLSKIKNAGTQTQVLENLTLKNISIPAFKLKLMKKENLHIGEFITYARFSELYANNFFPLSELEYAEKILGIARNNFYTIKYNPDRKASIFKDETITEEEIRIIQDQILEQYKLGESVNIDVFNKIYNKFSSRLLPKDFAEQVLSISNSQFKDMKSKGTKVRLALRENEYIQNLFTTLHDNGYYLGYKLDLHEFEALYKTFGKNATMPTFANILCINYWQLLRGGKQSILPERIKLAKDSFKEIIADTSVEFHSIQEMQDFCKKHNVTFDEFKKHVLGTLFYDTSLLSDVLEEKGGCWYGELKINCSHEFVETHTSQILEIANSISKKWCFKYGLNNSSDEYSSEATLYIIEKCGDLEKNYDYREDVLFSKIRQRVNLAIKGKIISDNFRCKPSSPKRYCPSFSNDFEIFDFSNSIEDIVISNSNTKSDDYIEQIIGNILVQAENGSDIDIILESFSAQLHQEKHELVLLIKDYYLRHKTIRER